MAQTTIHHGDAEAEAIAGILFPLDGSDAADAVLDQARWLLGLPGTRAHLFTAVDPLVFRYTLRPRRGLDDLERLERNLGRETKHLEQLATRLAADGVDVRFEARSGVGAEAILARVAELRPSLTVLRSRASRGAPWHFGSVSRRVLRHCPTPLLILQEDGDSPFESILVPLDGSDHSNGVLPMVERLAGHCDASVILCRFAEGPHEFIDAPDGPGPASHDRLRSTLSHAVDRLAAAGIQATARVGMGDPATEILRVASEEGVDLIAMTTHGRSGWTRWVLGSVADQVFSTCRRPLLVVRTGGPAVTPQSLSEP